MKRTKADPRRIAELERWHERWEAGEDPDVKPLGTCCGPLKAPRSPGVKYDPRRGDPAHPDDCICKVVL